MSGVLDTLRSATPLSRSVTVCLNGDLQAEWDDTFAGLDLAQLADAAGTSRGSLAAPEAAGVIDRLEELRETIAASEVVMQFQRIDPFELVALRAKHPPREGNAADKVRGYNTSTFFRAEIAASCVSITDASGEVLPGAEVPADVWDSLLGAPATDATPAVIGALNLRQLNELINAAESVNTGETAVPPSARSLNESRDSGASLAQPSPGTSPRDASKGGSRRGSPKSSGTRKATSTKGRSRAT